MPLDRVVDSAVLDGAMTATANAIREKTGSTERIAWDETKGFTAPVDEVYEAGRKAADEAFWNIILCTASEKRLPIQAGASREDKCLDVAVAGYCQTTHLQVRQILQP